MKRILIAGLSILSLTAAISPSALAATRQQNLTSVSMSTQTRHLAPGDLVRLAYQGQFQTQGIPGYASLVNAHAVGRVSAEDLIRAAIATGRVSSSTLMDQTYVRVVTNQLADLSDS